MPNWVSILPRRSHCPTLLGELVGFRTAAILDGLCRATVGIQQGGRLSPASECRDEAAQVRTMYARQPTGPFQNKDLFMCSGCFAAGKGCLSSI